MKVLLFPIETEVRELDFRIALAVSLVQLGFKTILGKHAAIRSVLPVIDGSMYVGKQLIRPHFPSDVSELRLFNEFGVRFTHFDTEGAIFAGDQNAWQVTLDSRLAPKQLTPNSAIFTWGSFQARHYKRTTDLPVFSVGNPAFDLLRPQRSAYFSELSRRIEEKYSPYVLVNTSFARANHGHGLEQIFHKNTGYSPNDPVNSQLAIRKWAFQNRSLTDIIELVDHLERESPHLNIVVRPHPSETTQFYESIFAGRPRIFVERAGSVGPWLKSAQAMIHNGCTTAVEAWFAGTPAIQYETTPSTISVRLPEELSHRAHNVEDCQRLVDAAKELDQPKASPCGEDLIANFSHDSFLEFANCLQELSIPHSSLDLRMLHLHYQKFWLAEKAKAPLRRFSERHRKAYTYSSGKFPGFLESDVAQRIKRANHVMGQNASLTFIGENLFVIG